MFIFDENLVKLWGGDSKYRGEVINICSRGQGATLEKCYPELWPRTCYIEEFARMFPVDAFLNGKFLSLSYTVFCFSSKGNPFSCKVGKYFRLTNRSK